MQIEKEKRRVSITCQDGSSVRGLMHLIQSQRTADFLNDPKDNFITLTEAEIYHAEDVHSFKLASKLVEKKDMLVLNKSFIKWVEEITD